MNSLSPSDPRLFRLLWAVCDGTATAAQREQLEAALAESDALCDLYLRYTAMYAELMWQGQSDDPAQQWYEFLGPEIAEHQNHASLVLSRPPAPWWRRRLSLPEVAATLAAGILFTIYIVVISRDLPKANQMAHTGRSQFATENPAAPDTNTAPPAGEDLATLDSLPGARWADAPQASASDAPPAMLLDKPLHLLSGMARVRLKSGTTLLIAGPTDWTLKGDNEVALTRGKLVATVPERAIGFTVKTPTTEIVDLGTEFGVEVSDRGETKTHVFRGEIRVEPPTVATRSKVKSITLTAGQAARVDRSGKTAFIEPLASTPTEFIRSPDASDQDDFNPDRLSPYAKYVIEQARPVAYWDFSRFRDPVKIVQDRLHEAAIERFEPWRDLLAGPCIEDGHAGFGPINPALSFVGHQQLQIELTDALALDHRAYSLQLWFRFTKESQPQAVSYLFGRGTVEGNQVLGCDSLFLLNSRQSLSPSDRNANRQIKGGTLRFFSGAEGLPSLPRSGNTVIEPDRWHSLAFTRDGEQVRVYLNGALEIECQNPWRGGEGKRLAIGKRADMPLPSALNWNGLLDELAIWNRALTAEEVAAMYRQAIGDSALLNVPEEPSTEP